MSQNLKLALRALAEQVPPAAVPEELFDRARTRHRRRATAVTGGLAVVALLLVIGYVLQPAAGIPVAARPDPSGLPDRLIPPPLWTATVEQSRPGTAAMMFSGTAVRDDWNEGRVAVVAADADRYRVFDEFLYTPPGFEAHLSPDGRFVWRGGIFYDLASGKSRPDGFDGYVLAYAPDGEQVAYSSDAELVNGNPYATPRVGLHDVGRGSDVLRMRVFGWIPPGWSAAVSRDGQRLAVQVSDEVWLARVGDVGADGFAEPYLKIGLAGGRLAGAGSWLPDGKSLAVVERFTCAACPVPTYPRTFRLALRDAETGEPVAGAMFPQLPSATFVQVLGWRSPDVAVALVGVPGPDAVDQPDNHEVVWGPYHEPGTEAVRLVLLHRGAAQAEVLFETPAGISELAVAADLAVAGKFRESNRPSYGPPHPYFLAGGGCLLVVLAIPVVLVVRWWRRQRRAERDRVSAAGDDRDPVEGDGPGSGQADGPLT
ncbi:MAG TPA: hypothetical protein VFX61_03165 [Micromonosporaceae bacterium]|nr:hypothetical protein [Micromonosporaceae bacterium]